MIEAYIAVRFAPRDPIVFCRAGDTRPRRGDRVRLSDERIGRVEIPVDGIIAIPALPDAPYVLATLEPEPPTGSVSHVSLCTVDGAVTTDDVRMAVARAALLMEAL